MSMLIMQPEDIDRIAEVITQKLDEKRKINEEQHQCDHDWIKTKREREESFRGARGRFIEKIAFVLGSMGIIGFVYWVGHAILNTLQDMLGRGGPP